MGLFRRDRALTDQELGRGTVLRVAAVDGQLAALLGGDKHSRRVLDLAQPALRFLRAAGVAGDVAVRTDGGRTRLEIDLDAGGVLHLEVEPSYGLRLVAPDGAADDEPAGWVDVEDPTLVDPQEVLGELVYGVSSILAGGGGAPELPGPVSATEASVQLLRASGDLPARWVVCVFVTRDHDVPEGADDPNEAERRRLWVEHSVGVKLHLDGAMALDPDDDDQAGERSRESLATASDWVGAPLDLVPYARWLVEATERHIGRRLTA